MFFAFVTGSNTGRYAYPALGRSRPMAGERERGRLPGTYPYYRFGRGDRTLVVLPGLGDAFAGESPSRLAARTLEHHYFSGFTDGFDVAVVGRRRHLPADHSTRAMAADCAEAIDALDAGGPVDVYGLSLGGLVAQHLAVDFPDLVDRLVLGVAGARLGETGRRIARRWTNWAETGRWREIAADSAVVSYVGWRRRVYPPVLRATSRFFPEPADIGDVAVSGRAALDHDATDRLPDIEAPTLVAGGTADRFFPEEILVETADLVPDARLELFEGGGHGVYEERKKAFDASVKAFLDG